MAFAWLKGHGTENDFVLLPDHDGTVHGDLDPSFVAALCHRRTGIGADGVLRVMRDPTAGSALWFMDYRNADGSVSQMCGNGVRVFARHLVDDGLVDGPEFDIATRDGIKHVVVDDTMVSVGMGPFTVGGTSTVRTEEGSEFDALEVHTGNPHAVAFVGDLSAAGALAREPYFDVDVYPEGVNVEFAHRIDPSRVAMRVHERGSGETRSCGTGACATAVATAVAAGVDSGSWQVDVPGGSLFIDVLTDRTTRLTGPAVIVARGELTWLA